MIETTNLLIIASFASMMLLSRLVINPREPNYKPIHYKASNHHLLAFVLPFFFLVAGFKNLANMMELILTFSIEIYSHRNFDLSYRLIFHSLANLSRAYSYYDILGIFPNIILIFPIVYFISYFDEMVSKLSYFNKIKEDKSHYLYIVSLNILYFYSICFMLVGYFSFFFSVTLSLLIFNFNNILFNLEKIPFLKSNFLLNSILSKEHVTRFLFYITIWLNWLVLAIRLVENNNLISM